MVARERFYDPIEVEGLVCVLKGHDGLDSFSCHQSSEDRHEPKPTLILGEHVHRELLSIRLLGGG